MTHCQDLTNLTLAGSQGALLEGYLLVPEANVSRRFAHVLHQPCLLPGSDTAAHWSNCCKKRESVPSPLLQLNLVLPTMLLWGLRYPEPVKALECTYPILWGLRHPESKPLTAHTPFLTDSPVLGSPRPTEEKDCHLSLSSPAPAY